MMTFDYMSCEEEEAYKELVSMIESEITCLSIDEEYHNICQHERPTTQLLPEFTHSTTIHEKRTIFSYINMVLWLVFPSALLLGLLLERTK